MSLISIAEMKGHVWPRDSWVSLEKLLDLPEANDPGITLWANTQVFLENPL